MLLVERALRFANPFPLPARHYDLHDHECQDDGDGDEGDRRRRDDQHDRKREDDHRLGEDVDRRAGDELVGNVRGARHRLDE